MSRSVRSSNSARAVTAFLISRSNSWPRSLYRLITPFNDSDEFNMRCSHKLLVNEGYLPCPTCASRAAAELVQLAAIANLAST
jgi:hypothetical protein